jgi:uncharacterized protein YcnI
MRTAVALAVALVALAVPAAAQAHVEISPESVEPGSFTLFTVLSPNESRQPLTGLRLTIPDDLDVDAVADSTGFTGQEVRDQRHRIVALSWQGGSVAPGHLALFRFSASVPEHDATVEMTGLQTFADGSTRVWHTPRIDVAPASGSGDGLTRGLAIAAAVVAVAALALAVRARRPALR